MKVIMNGETYTLKEIRKHLDFMSELGYWFRPLPSFDGCVKFQVWKNDDIVNSKDYEIRGCDLDKIFSFTNITFKL